MATETTLHVNITDTADYKHITSYGGSTAIPATFEDIYTQMLSIKPEWVNKEGNNIYFLVPLILGDSTGTYYTKIDDDSKNIIVERVYTSNLSYSQYLYCIGVSGTLDNMVFIVDGNNIKFANIIDEDISLVSSDCCFRCSDDINVEDSSSYASYHRFNRCTFYNDNLIIKYIDSILSSCVFASGAVVIKENIGTFNGGLFKLGSVLKIEHSCIISSPKFEDMKIEFNADTLTLEIRDLAGIDNFSYIKNLSTYSGNIIKTEGSATLTVDSDLIGTHINGAAVVLKDKNSSTLYSGTTNSSGQVVLTNTVLSSLTLASAGEVVTSYDFNHPYRWSFVKNSKTFYDFIDDYKIATKNYTIDATAISDQRLVGYSVDIDNKITTANRVKIRRSTPANIKCRIYDSDGNLLDLSSATVAISFYKNSYDTAAFLTSNATTKTASGEAVFSIAASIVNTLINDKYYYKIFVGTNAVIADYTDIIN